MRNYLKLAAILGLVTLMTTGCSSFAIVQSSSVVVPGSVALMTSGNKRATGSVSPSTDLSLVKTMYVKKSPADNREVNVLVADKLRSKGVTVTTGVEAPPANVDAVVTYIDKWMWDVTMYMLELTINIDDPKTGAQLATGDSLHGSLTRKSPTEMVDEVIESIYKSKK